MNGQIGGSKQAQDSLGRANAKVKGLAVEAKNITVVKHGRQIIKDISLNIYYGEVLIIIGANGAGKSTLLTALSANDHFEDYNILINNKHIKEYSIKELSKSRSVLSQQNNIAFAFNVYEIVQMGRMPFRGLYTKDEDEKAIYEAMDNAHMLKFAARNYRTLSGGEQARCCLARVLAQNSDIMFLDEPTAPLDILHQESVMQVARNEAAKGRAVVVVVHDLNLAAGYADKIALLKQGELLKYGTPDEVLRSEILSDAYNSPIEVIEHPIKKSKIIVPVRF